MDVRIVAISPKGTRKVFPVETTLTLGRDMDCDLRIPLAEISRKHCQITREAQKVILKDLDSTNGTLVNGQRVNETELQPGDIISLAGAINFMIQVDGQPAEIDESKLVKTVRPKETKTKESAEPAQPLSATSTTPTEEDVADEILGESFFMEDEEEEE